MGATVLLVDDDAPTRRAARVSLHLEGYHVVEAESRADCLSLLARHEVDLIFLELRLPDASGWDLMRELSHNPRWRHIPVVLMSADPPWRWRETGAAGCVHKPYDVGTLVAHAHELVAGR